MPRSTPPATRQIRVAPAPACSRLSPLRVRSRKAVERCGGNVWWKGAVEWQWKGSGKVR